MVRAIRPGGGGPLELAALALGVAATLTGYATGRLRGPGGPGRLVGPVRRARDPGGAP
ncbi:hypothetical protein ACFQ0T_06860 [Kitasatospora gansuensis]